MRKPLVAGQFYEAEKDKLIVQIEESFRKGEGFPKPLKNNKVIGAIIPHAGYFFSGKAAAESVKEIAETKIDTFVILGVNHTGLGKNSTIKDDFKMPLGTVEINEELQKLIMKECSLEINKEAHELEHSIEVILPLLQYAMHEVSFVPIIVSENPKEFAKGLKKAISLYEKKKKKKVCVIASSDMTHYGYSYRYVPFSADIKEKLYELDKGAIDFIKLKDGDGFLDYVKRTGATICGRNTIAALLYYFAGSKRIKAELLDYYTSGDVVNDYNSAVGYAAIVFKESS